MSKIYVKATAKNIDMTPRKIGLVASLVRGRSVADALTILDHTPRRAAIPVKKVIESAKANATHNHNAVTDSLEINELHVSPGARLKRFKPVARGQAHPFIKRSSHVTVVLTGAEKQKLKAAKTTPKVNKPALTKENK